MSEKKDINEVINSQYFLELNKCAENFENTKRNIKSKIGISGYKYYDICHIDSKHPLNDYVSKTIDGLHEKEDNSTYTDYAGIVFDDGTYNFHIFPKDQETCNNLSNEYAKLRTQLLIAIYEKLTSNDCSIKIKNGFEKNYKIYIEKYENEKRKKEKISLWGGKGKGSPFTRYNNVIAAANQNATLQCLIYKFVEIVVDKVSYTINFMRYTYNGSIVGCTMRAIQFHKDNGCVNKDSKQQLDICHPMSNIKREKFSICYPQTDKDSRQSFINCDYYKENSAGNVCYNPPISWPGYNKETEKYNEEDITEIVNWFIYFIEKEGKKEDMTLDKYNDKKHNKLKIFFSL